MGGRRMMLAALLLLLMAAAGSGAAAHGSAAAGAGRIVPPVLAACAAQVALGRASAREADVLAQRAAALGFPALAQALTTRAISLRLGSAPPLSDCVVYVAPLPGVRPDIWTEYVRRSRQAALDEVSATGRLGRFQLDARELADVGLLADASKVRLEDGRVIWSGAPAPGVDLRAFLASADAQYQAFAALTRLQAATIATHLGDVIGTILEGQPATLSGLLAVARKARLSGLRKWVEDASDRAAHTATTDRYRLLNGIF